MTVTMAKAASCPIICAYVSLAREGAYFDSAYEARAGGGICPV